MGERRRSGPWPSCLAVVLVAAAGSCGAGRAADTVTEAVTRVVGDRLTWTRRGRGERCHRDTVFLDGPHGWAYVDWKTHMLVGFRRSLHGRFSTVVTLDQARAAALAAIRRAGIALGDSWVQTVEERNDHGSAGQEYVFEWRRFLHGVQLPSSIEVCIDCHTGKVCGFYLYDDPVVVPIAARLTAAEAARLTADEARLTGYTLRDAVLWVDAFPSHPSPQAVFWEVTLEERASGRQIVGRVHANSGQVGGLYFAGAGSGPLGGKRSPERGSPRLRRPPLDLRAAARAKIPPTVFELAARRAKMPRGSSAPARRGGAAHAPAM